MAVAFSLPSKWHNAHAACLPFPVESESEYFFRSKIQNCHMSLYLPAVLLLLLLLLRHFWCNSEWSSSTLQSHASKSLLYFFLPLQKMRIFKKENVFTCNSRVQPPGQNQYELISTLIFCFYSATCCFFIMVVVVFNLYFMPFDLITLCTKGRHF